MLEVAESLFASKGFDNTTIREIAREARVGVGTVYEYFPDKKSLLFAIPTVRIKELVEQLNECLYVVPGALDKLRKLVHFFLSYYQKNTNFARLMYLVMVPYQEWRHSPTYQLARSLTNILSAILREGQEQGLIRNDVDVRLMRNLYLGAIERLTVSWLLGSKGYNLVDVSEGLAQLLINAVKKLPEQKVIMDCPMIRKQRLNSQADQSKSMAGHQNSVDVKPLKRLRRVR